MRCMTSDPVFVPPFRGLPTSVVSRNNVHGIVKWIAVESSEIGELLHSSAIDLKLPDTSDLRFLNAQSD